MNSADMETGAKRPILVTGAHRSGSTWVGQMIARSPSVGYIHEPFNILSRSGACGGKFENWFTYVCDSNAALYYERLRECIEFRYPLARRSRAAGGLREAARALADYSRFTYNRVSGKRPLIKDPIAIFSAEWLARTFDMDVIVLVRHPAAFAGSLKQANWPHPFQHFRNQPLLLRDHLSDYTAEIEAFAYEKHDIIDQAILLWNMIHSTISGYRRAQPEWYFVRHEDISEDPIAEFGTIFQKLHLDYSPAVQKEILEFTRSGDADTDPGTLSIKRASRDNVWSWTERLTTEEIERVRAGTVRVSSHFYGAEDW